MAVIINYSSMRTIALMTNYSRRPTVRKYRGSAEDKSEGTVGANPSEANLTKSSSCTRVRASEAWLTRSVAPPVKLGRR